MHLITYPDVVYKVANDAMYQVCTKRGQPEKLYYFVLNYLFDGIPVKYIIVGKSLSVEEISD